MGKMLFVLMVILGINSLKAASQAILKPLADTAAKPISIKVLPQNFYKAHLGFFCKKELQVQKLTKLPVFFRLGSKQYVDYLERKPNAVKSL